MYKCKLTEREGEAGWSVKELEGSKVCIESAHAERSSVRIHRQNMRWENCPSLSLIPSVCLRQLVITKATHREDEEALEGRSAKGRER